MRGSCRTDEVVGERRYEDQIYKNEEILKFFSGIRFGDDIKGDSFWRTSLKSRVRRMGH